MQFACSYSPTLRNCSDGNLGSPPPPQFPDHVQHNSFAFKEIHGSEDSFICSELLQTDYLTTPNLIFFLSFFHLYDMHVLVHVGYY